MTENVYRVVNVDTSEPVEGGSFKGKQHFYTKKHVAQGVATQMTNAAQTRSKRYGTDPKQFKVQRATVVWGDVND